MCRAVAVGTLAPVVEDLLATLPARVDIEIEVSRFGVIKQRADGSLDFISPLPCPYNYGSIPGRTGGDGDPLDALLLGPRRQKGRVAGATVVGIVDFIDAGAVDAKVICATNRVFKASQRRGIERFFYIYAVFKRVLNRIRRLPGETRFRGVVLRDHE